MGNQKKRLDRISANLSAKDRSIAILDAVRRDDMATAISLEETTPRKSYRGPDGAVRQTVDVVENLSLRFDRAFYASVLILQVADAVVDEKTNEVVATIEEYYSLKSLDWKYLQNVLACRWSDCWHFLRLWKTT